MYKHLLLMVCLLPLAARAESAKAVPKAPDPPGLTYVLPRPKGPMVKLPPNVLLAPIVPLPGSASPLILWTPLAPTAPSPLLPPMRLLVLRDDDRAVIRTIHPLFTTEVPVQTILVKPALPKAKR